MSLESIPNSSPLNEIESTSRPILKAEDLNQRMKASVSGSSFNGKISSLNDLSPELREAIEENLAQKICSSARKHVEKLKEMRREAERIQKESS